MEREPHGTYSRLVVQVAFRSSLKRGFHQVRRTKPSGQVNLLKSAGLCRQLARRRLYQQLSEIAAPTPVPRYHQAGETIGMQIIYAAPFMMLSVAAFLVCLAVPRWRRYKLQALVAPVTFGFCSIVTAGAVVLTADMLNLGLFAQQVSGAKDAVPLLLIYFIPGLVGSWGAVAVVNRITAHR
jgi:hypothetical protein